MLIALALVAGIFAVPTPSSPVRGHDHITPSDQSDPSYPINDDIRSFPIVLSDTDTEYDDDQRSIIDHPELPPIITTASSLPSKNSHRRGCDTEGYVSSSDRSVSTRGYDSDESGSSSQSPTPVSSVHGYDGLSPLFRRPVSPLECQRPWDDEYENIGSDVEEESEGWPSFWEREDEVLNGGTDVEPLREAQEKMLKYDLEHGRLAYDDDEEVHVRPDNVKEKVDPNGYLEDSSSMSTTERSDGSGLASLPPTQHFTSEDRVLTDEKLVRKETSEETSNFESNPTIERLGLSPEKLEDGKEDSIEDLEMEQIDDTTELSMPDYDKETVLKHDLIESSDSDGITPDIEYAESSLGDISVNSDQPVKLDFSTIESILESLTPVYIRLYTKSTCAGGFFNRVLPKSLQVIRPEIQIGDTEYGIIQKISGYLAIRGRQLSENTVRDETGEYSFSHSRLICYTYKTPEEVENAVTTYREDHRRLSLNCKAFVKYMVSEICGSKQVSITSIDGHDSVFREYMRPTKAQRIKYHSKSYPYETEQRKEPSHASDLSDTNDSIHERSDEHLLRNVEMTRRNSNLHLQKGHESE